MRILFMLFTMIFLSGTTTADTNIPDILGNIEYDNKGKMFFITGDGDTLYQIDDNVLYTLDQFRALPVGTENGIKFDFNSPEFEGIIYYGFRPGPDEVKYTHTIYSKNSAEIDSGAAYIDIKNQLVGKYDIADWQTTGLIRLGYRIVDESGLILYDGKIRLNGKGPFVIDTSIIEGPFINLVTDSSAVVSFITSHPIISAVKIDNRIIESNKSGLHHEIFLSGLKPDTKYYYTVVYGPHEDIYHFTTAPKPGSRKPFTFAYASDGRGNNGGGERDKRGVNAYILKKIAALISHKDAKFFQFTGDMIDGYTTSPGRINLEYANWKRTVEPFAHYTPFICGFGNHEVLVYTFKNSRDYAMLNKFPYDSISSEVVFAQNFVNPKNGPVSEDGSKYDPDPEKMNFPFYEENVFYYTYDNVAIISLNCNYWFSPTIKNLPASGGNLHGYIMDNQLVWLKETLGAFETDPGIDHIFITLHTPIFPNGGHVKDDMWYSGDNKPRPTIAGKPVEKGIIERRDELLDLLMNHSTKVKAALTGDEHNYSLLKITPDMPKYPDDYDKQRLEKGRPIYQINNGAAGAPYYGKEKTPWQDHVTEFTTQNAVVFFHINGRDIKVEVINPDTYELIDEFEI